MTGYWGLFLHAHLPFVRHPEYEYFLEEHWLFEALAECYLPLLRRFYRLSDDGVDFQLTMSLTPTLASMLADPMLIHRFARYLDRTAELAEKEIRRTEGHGDINRLARYYLDRLTVKRRFFEDTLGSDVLRGFRELADRGALEIVTCGATHGFLPLLAYHPPSVEAQIEVAVRTHRRLLGRDPAGIMLPECAYYPGLEDVLKRHGLGFFFLDSHGLLFSRPRSLFGVFAPIFTPNGVAVFGRDHESSKQVWSSREGYPGDFVYRDFYRDVGFDLDMDHVGPYVSPDGLRTFTGIKYYRITGDTDHKELYDPEAALGRAREHAANFVFNRERQAEHLRGLMGKPPFILSPYDAELYGHWWFEGPDFIEHVFRHMAPSTMEPVSLARYLEENPTHQVATPCASSWGNKGYYEVWLNGSNDWVWRYLHNAGIRMSERARRYTAPDPLRERILNQMARELLLAQSSDWPFIMTMGTSVEYAERRFKLHIDRFNQLDSILDEGWDEEKVRKMEEADNIFPDIDYRVYGR
ncbi:MAG: DUF1957 domain-containing protein [bacterium]|nr:DUF1957 domain-containing protein [bacterium]MDT8395021.1 1,4-alpha-glucan branching protein domain-containing protein [bacterium]